MRREIIIFAVILAVVLTVGLYGRSLITGIAVSEIKNIFPGYDVSIGSAEIRNADMIAINGINAKKGKGLYYRIEGLEIKFSPLSLFTKKVPKITVKNSYLDVNSWNKKLQTWDKKLKDAIDYPVFRPGQGFMAKSITVLNFNLTLDTADWKLNTEVSGNIEIRKTPAGETEIDADLSTVPGNAGKIAISDEAFLKRLAENAKQPLAAIEDLKNFDFTEGTFQISGKPGSLLLHVTLKGLKGKKDLTFPLRGL